jgi:hypothetical protein
MTIRPARREGATPHNPPSRSESPNRLVKPSSWWRENEYSISTGENLTAIPAE